MSRPPPPGPVLIDLRVEPQRALEEATAALRAGRVVLLPTDTVYGLAALTPAAEEDLFALKGRPADRSIAVLVADRPAAESLAASVPEPLAELMDRHWPGPLTVVLPRPQTSVPQVGGNRETIGVRCPNHPWLRSLLAEVGPLATTSANRHAQQTPTHATEVLAALTPDHESAVGIAVAIDGGPCTGQASTVVTWQDGELKILRSGPLRLEPSNSA
ncbi:MAG: L-threonylcarbamoyladenylate synthase [bacterium]|nr:L-threonylcarbamoyladenylate synthase [bacterium]